MGMQTAPAQLFYDFCLDDHVPEDHLLRRIDRFLDLEKVRTELKPFYSNIGRPSIDPELMMRMLIVGYCMGIRSERRLCDEIHLNLAYRWFCRLGLDGRCRTTPPSRATVMAGSGSAAVPECLRKGLVGGEGFAVDASLIAADANKQRSIPGDQWRISGLDADARRAVREYLATMEWLGQGASDRTAHPGVRQVQPDRRHLLPVRLHVRRRTQPLHLPPGQAAGAVPTDLRDAALGHHQGWDAVIPIEQV